jgi:probable phosphoglycerate mutase
MPPRWRFWRWRVWRYLRFWRWRLPPRRCAAFFLWRAALWLRTPHTTRGLTRRLMLNDQHNGQHTTARADGATTNVPTAADTNPDGQGTQPGQEPRKRILLVRHGQTTYNVEKRLPGQLPGVSLTDTGRRQAHRAAVALAGLPLSAVVSSPLERARDTAAIIARGWGLEVRLDPRLMDTDVGRWSGQVIEEIDKNDPAWKAFVAHPTQPPEGVEGFTEVTARVVAAVEAIRHDPDLGEYVAVVAHADVIKLIVAHYTGIQPDCAPYLHVDNASISALGFLGEHRPVLLALNWTPLPGWLAPWKAPDAPATTQSATAAAGAEAAAQTNTQPGAAHAQPLPAGMDHAPDASGATDEQK